MDVDIPTPNPAIGAALVSPRMREIVADRVGTAAMLYQAQVAKRTAALARSAHPHTEIGGVHQDRWIGVLVVGGPSAYGEVDYAAAHEFGAEINLPNGGMTDLDPAHDLNAVLAQLAMF